MRTFGIVLFLVLLLVTFAPTSASLAQGTQSREASAQLAAKKESERINQQQLITLMSAVGIHVDATARFKPGQTYQSLHLQLTTQTSAATPANSLAQTFSSNITSSERRNGELPRQRSIELSSVHLVLVTVDSANRLRWWSVVPDPRILRGEEPDAQNRLSGRTIYRPNIEAMFEIPDDAAANELRFYHPQWTGERFVLTLVSTVALNKN